nr:Chain C, Protein Tax-1 [HTLV-1 subtype A]7PC4_C Chain C, Protein Tax-1 [HTLV-1 subtype A]7PC9_C Chain C, Protein Tax-1 [HTLV-1 subtype A]
SEKHFRETEV